MHTTLTSGTLAFSLLTSPLLAQISSYTSSGNGVWNTALNWSNGVPNGAGQTAFLGPSANAKNTRVTLGSNVSLDGLLITDGMHLDMNGKSLAVTQAIPASGLRVLGSNLIDGEQRPSQLIVDPYFVLPNFLDTGLVVKDASFEEGAMLYLSEDGARALVTGNLAIDSESSIAGDGLITFVGKDTLNNNGTIQPDPGGTIMLRQLGDTDSLNLDGSNHTGILSATAGHATIQVIGAITAGSFDGIIDIGTGGEVSLSDGALFGAIYPADITINSRPPVLGTLKVGNDKTVWLRLGSTLTSTGTGSIDGNLKLTGATGGPTVEVTGELNSHLRITGTSQLNGGFVKVGGNIEFMGGITESSNVGFIMDGGELHVGVPSMVKLSGNKLEDRLSGHGLWKAGVQNDTAIAAQGGTLIVDTTGNPADFDGFDDLGEIHAAGGDLTLIQPDGGTWFDSRAIIANGHTLTLDTPVWEFRSTSELIMGGDDEGGILEASTDLIFKGTTTVSLDSEIRASSKFTATSKTSISGSQLLLSDNSYSKLESGASFTGTGTLKIGAGSSLNTSPLDTIGTHLTIAGSLTVNATDPGFLTLNRDFTMEPLSTTSLDINGGPMSLSYDLITVKGTLKPEGLLQINVNHPTAKIGDTWKIIQANQVIGTLASFTSTGTPAGTKLIPFTTNDGIFVKLVPDALTYLDWTTQNGLTPANHEPFQDPDHDTMSNALEMFVGGNPLKPEPHLLPIAEIVEAGGGRYLALSFYKATPAFAPTLNAVFESSTNLEDWSPIDLIEHASTHFPLECRHYLTLRMPTPITKAPQTFLRISFP